MSHLRRERKCVGFRSPSKSEERTNAVTKKEALNGKPYVGKPHVRFDEGEVAPCTAEALLRRVHCRRQPEGGASMCAATPRRGSLLYNRFCIAALVLAVTGMVSAGTLTVKFGSAMEVEIDGEVRSFAKDDTFFGCSAKWDTQRAS